nr:YiiX/YebB-like N1pC/P60 family cysteine hydrolase [Sphingomonas arenae]
MAEPRPELVTGICTPVERLRACLEPGDVLLVEGTSRVSTAIKYLTQSSWSHAALYVGELAAGRLQDPSHKLIEADVVEGVRSVPLDEYGSLPTRICRPVGLSTKDRQLLVDYVVNRLGHSYDTKNLLDLARYLMPTPPVPAWFRRRLIALGSGDPTRAICSTLIAQAFAAIRYPILPTVEYREEAGPSSASRRREILHIRHHSLYTPRDFDVSPYFQIVKPTVEGHFNFRRLHWAEDAGAPEIPPEAPSMRKRRA